MAFPVTLNGRTYTLADFSGTNYVEGFPAALEDFVTQAGNIYTTTSTSSVAIGTGSKTFTVADSGKPYTVGTPLRISDAAAPATNWIDGIVTSYSGTTLVVNAVAYAGSGTIASWNINIGGSAIAYTGTLPVAQGGTGATTAADARTNLDTYSKAEADSRFLNVSGEASDVTMNGNVTIGDAGTDTLTVNATATMSDATLTTADINGGSIDGTVIGGSTPAAISGTTGQFGTSLNVDGTITSDGLTVDGATVLNNSNADVDFTVKGDNGTAIFVDGGTNDISFYEDTGTTPKFFWDASAESLGIGTSSPAEELDVNGTIKATNVSDGTLSIPTTYVTNGSAKAWMHYNHNTATLNQSFNVSSVTDAAVGEATYTYSSALDAANYCLQVSGKTDDDNTESTGNKIWVRPFGSTTTTGSSLAVDTGGTARDCNILCHTTLGDLA